MYILSEKVHTYYKNQTLPKNNALFTDELFPPNENSLLSKDANGNYIDPIDGESKSTRINTNEIIWKRASDIFESDYLLFENFIEINDVKQGDLGNCYFLSALAALCSYPNLIYQIFKTKTVNQYGYYEIILFINGKFQIVIIDDYFPVQKDNPSQLQFAKPNNNEIWVLLLEKAWAKVNGGYTNIIGGSPRSALKALTGFCSENIKTHALPKEELFAKINEALSYKCIICSTTSKSKEMNVNCGLIANHVYTVLSTYVITKKKKQYCLLQIRNPWGFMEWSGKWSDKSAQWTQDIQEQVGFKCDENDGVFYMELDDFVDFFVSTDICYIQYSSKTKMYVVSSHENLPHVFNLYVEDDASLISVSLNKPHWRFNRELKLKAHPCMMVLAKLSDEHSKYSNKHCIEFIGQFESDEDVEITKILNHGKYIVYAFYFKEQSSEPYFTCNDINIKASSNSEFKFVFAHYDHKFSLLKYLILTYLYEQETLKNKTKTKHSKGRNNVDRENTLANINEEILTYTSSNFCNSGLGYRAVINNSNTTLQLWENSTNNLTNMKMFKPYNKKDSFNFEVMPRTARIVMGMKIDKYESFWFNLSSKFTNITLPFEVLDMKPKSKSSKKVKGIELAFDYVNKVENVKNDLNVDLSLFIIDNTLLIDSKYNYDYISLPLSIASKSSMVVDSNLEIIKTQSMLHKIIVRKLLEFPKSFIEIKSSVNFKWKQIDYGNYIYIGQVNPVNENKREGVGAIVYKELENNVKYHIGYWDNDVKNGFGKEYLCNGFCCFSGNYVNGVRNGIGTSKEKNYNSCLNVKYHGMYKNGYRNGFGVAYLDNGARWEGCFVNGYKHGKGRFYPSEESPMWYNVTFVNNKYVCN